MFERVSKRPTHRIFAVRKITDEKSFWSECGGAWQHADGQGLSLRFTLMPVGDADIVVRAVNAPRLAGGPQ
jgi:hypothetical protein